MRLSSLKITLLVLLISWLSGLTVSAIEVEVHNTSSSLRKNILKITHSLTSINSPDSLIVDSLKIFLNQMGFLDVSFENKNSKLIVAPGSQTSLRKIIISGDLVDSLVLNSPLEPKQVESMYQQIIDSLESEGHYYARITIDSIVRTGYDADIYVKLNAGPVVLISEIQVQGLKYSDPKLVRRILTQSVSNQLNSQNLNESRRKASRISWLDFVPPIEVLPRPGYQSADLKFNFREKKRFSFFGGFGYQSADNTGLVWQLATQLKSPFGQGRNIKLASERRDVGSQSLQIQYRQPSFWLGSGEFGLDLFTRDFRSEFSEFRIQTFVDYKLNHETSWGTELGYKRSEPANLKTGHSRYTVSLKLNRSTLSDDYNPSSGYQLSSSWQYAFRRYSEDSLALVPDKIVYHDTRLEISLKTFWPISRKFILGSSVGYLGLETKEEDVPLSELFLIGGRATLRGYRNDRFASRQVGLLTIEPRFRFNTGYLFFFYDGALMKFDQFENNSYQTTEEYRHGFGVGLVISGRANRVAIAFGWQPELTIDQPRLNIALSTNL